MNATRILITRNKRLKSKRKKSYLNLINLLSYEYNIKHNNKKATSNIEAIKIDSMLENMWFSN